VTVNSGAKRGLSYHPHVAPTRSEEDVERVWRAGSVFLSTAKASLDGYLTPHAERSATLKHSCHVSFREHAQTV